LLLRFDCVEWCFLLLVPIPFVDLRLPQAEFFRKSGYRVLVPVRVLLVFLLKNARLVLPLSEPLLLFSDLAIDIVLND